MSPYRKLVSQTAIYGLSSILGRMLNLALTPLYTKMLAPDVYGKFTDLYSMITIMNVILTFGMETTFFRYMQDKSLTNLENKEIYNNAFLFVGGLALCVLLIGTLGAVPLAHFLGYAEMPQVIAMMAGVLFMDNLAALPLAKLRYEEKAKRFAGINLLNIFITISLNVYFVKFLHEGIEFIFIANLISSGVRLLCALYQALPTQFRINRSLLNDMLFYGTYIMIAGLAGMMNENLDKLLIRRLWHSGNLYHNVARTGDGMLGLYAAGYKMGIFISLVTQAFRYAAEPFFFKHSVEKDSPQTFARIFHYFMIACLACFLVISAFTYEIVSINIRGWSFIDPKYWEGLEVVPIVLMAYVFSAAYQQIAIWFKITKQTRFALFFTGTGAAITIILNVLTIPMYGYIGSAWATLICYAVMTVLVYYLGQKHYTIPYRISPLIVYGIVCTLAYFACVEIGGNTLNTVLAKSGICILVLGGIFLWERRVFRENFI